MCLNYISDITNIDGSKFNEKEFQNSVELARVSVLSRGRKKKIKKYYGGAVRRSHIVVQGQFQRPFTYTSELVGNHFGRTLNLHFVNKADGIKEKEREKERKKIMNNTLGHRNTKIFGILPSHSYSIISQSFFSLSMREIKKFHSGKKIPESKKKNQTFFYFFSILSLPVNTIKKSPTIFF